MYNKCITTQNWCIVGPRLVIFLWCLNTKSQNTAYQIFLEFKIPILFTNLGDFQLQTCIGCVTIIWGEVPVCFYSGMNLWRYLYRSLTCAKCIKWETACVNLGCEVRVWNIHPVSLHDFVWTRTCEVFVPGVLNLCKIKSSTCVKFDRTCVFFNDYLFYNITAIDLPQPRLKPVHLVLLSFYAADSEVLTTLGSSFRPC